VLATSKEAQINVSLSVTVVVISSIETANGLVSRKSASNFCGSTLGCDASLLSAVIEDKTHQETADKLYCNYPYLLLKLSVCSLSFFDLRSSHVASRTTAFISASRIQGRQQ